MAFSREFIFSFKNDNIEVKNNSSEATKDISVLKDFKDKAASIRTIGKLEVLIRDYFTQFKVSIFADQYHIIL